VPYHFDHPSTRADPCQCERHARRRIQQAESKRRNAQHQYKINDTDRNKVECLVARGVLDGDEIVRRTGMDARLVWQAMHAMELRNVC
jgi:hypothetical protein